MNQAKNRSASLLSNKTILITRPGGREIHLRRILEQAGGNVIHYPVININQPSALEIKQLNHLRDQLHHFDMAIFISPTAVEQSQLYFPVLPEHLTIVSIGSKTTQALQHKKIHVDLEAPEHNTESLLQTVEFQIPEIQAKRILIFRGTGGRALLGDSLIDRGAQVRYVETYRREIPLHPPLSEQQLKTLNAITISSNEGLKNLITLMQDPGLLIDIPLVVPGQRAATLAHQHGFKTIITAKNATDEAALIALNNFFSKKS
jgi:uroporphyrinogen-III synthase